jgi:hypothetical protein
MMAKRKPGRPKGSSLYDKPKVKQEIIDWMTKGKTLLSFCEREGAPSRQVVLLWVDEDPVFASHYKAAQERRHEVMLEEVERIADIEPETPVQATWRKYQMDTKLKILRMVNPARYGEKVNVDHNGGIQITLLTGVPDEES